MPDTIPENLMKEMGNEPTKEQSGQNRELTVFISPDQDSNVEIGAHLFMYSLVLMVICTTAFL